MKRYIYNNREHRLSKAKTIHAVLADAIDWNQSVGIEIGTGAGIMSAFFASRAKSLTSFDVVDERLEKGGYEFVLVDDAGIPCADNSVDFVISNQVIEHIEDQKVHLTEIFRVLKEGGVAYISTPNRFWPREVHSRLYFLGYLPRSFASMYYKKLKDEDWDVYPLSYFSLKKLIQVHSQHIIDYSPKIIASPEKYYYKLNARIINLARRLPVAILRIFSPSLPCLFFVIKKGSVKNPISDIRT